MKFRAQGKRSVIKAITFRVLIILSDVTVIFFITHRYDTTLAVVIATNLASTVLFYFHERIWNNIQWGRVTVEAPHTPV